MKISSQPVRVVASALSASTHNSHRSTSIQANNRPTATVQRSLQTAASTYASRLNKLSTPSTGQTIQRMSEADELNKQRFHEIWHAGSGNNKANLKSAIEFLITKYSIAPLSEFNLEIEEAEGFHGRTTEGYNTKAFDSEGNYLDADNYKKPLLVMSSTYINKVSSSAFERLIRTLIHEVEHVKDWSNISYRALQPTTDESEFRAYYAEVTSTIGGAPNHTGERMLKQLGKAFKHYDKLEEQHKKGYANHFKKLKFILKYTQAQSGDLKKVKEALDYFRGLNKAGRDELRDKYDALKLMIPASNSSSASKRHGENLSKGDFKKK